MKRRWVKRSKTEITIETRRVLLNQASQKTQWCAVCADSAPMVTPTEAAGLVGVTPRAIYRWIESDRLHFTEAADGSILICVPSLLTSAN